MGRGAWQATVHEVAESDTTEQLILSLTSDPASRVPEHLDLCRGARPPASGGSTTPKPEGGTGSWLHPCWDLAPARGSSTLAPGLSLSWFLSQRLTPAEQVASKTSAGQNKAMRLTVGSQA